MLGELGPMGRERLSTNVPRERDTVKHTADYLHGFPATLLNRRQAIAGLSAAAFAACMPVVARATESEGVPVAPAPANETVIVLSNDDITVDGDPVATESGSKVYIANDVVYYEDRDTYESGNPYGEGSADERHAAEDAAKVTVVHITEPGAYELEGKLDAGQIWVDLGEDAFDDPEAVVTLVLNGVDITCDVAPAVVFYRVFECDNAWTAETATAEVDTAQAGANVVINDGTVNNVTGGHVARIYKDNNEQKKLWKIDGAFYSFASMNVAGGPEESGVLNIVADNEGLDSELHLTINGGNISILSQDDGINTNEDGVSVTTINGGTLHILAGLGAEGDGVDSNGWLVINGGTVIAMANPRSDSGLDSDMGSYINGGTVVALGSTMDWAESDSNQVTMNLQFAWQQSAGDAIVVMDENGTIVFAYDPSEDEVAGTKIRDYQGAVVSCPAFEVGATYAVYIGGVVTGTESQGVYDAETITGYEGGTQQAYTGTDVRRGPGGFGGPGGPRGGMGEPPAMPGGERPEGMPEPPEMPADGGRPEGMPEPPSGERPADAPEPPSGELPEGAPEPPAMPEGEQPAGMQGNATGEASTDFYMQDKVNAFSGVTGV